MTVAKILIHSIVFKPDGVSTAYLYADLVSELKKYGHELVVLTSTPHYNKVESAIAAQPLIKRRGGLYYTSMYDGVEVYHIPMTKAKGTLRRIVDFIKFHVLGLGIGLSLNKFDVVLSPSPPLTIGVVGALIAGLKGGKAIYNVQEIYPDFAINQGVVKNGLLIKVLKGIEKFIYNRSAAVVTIDDKFSDIIRPRFKDVRKLHVIPNFVDTQLYMPGARHNAFSAQHGLDDKFVIAYAGNIGFAQNWEPVLHAAKALEHLPVTFLIVGDGVRKAWLREQIAERGINTILLLDYQPREAMPLINASADLHTIVMSADMDNDGFPSKIYTILASGRPVLVSTGSDSPLSNLMRKANAQRKVGLNDNESYAAAIAKAYAEREQLPAEGAAGRAFIEGNYSKEAVAMQYHQLIQRIAAPVSEQGQSIQVPDTMVVSNQKI
ncbi:glycosyltransferase WbuB [Chitinophaga parva]|uniref:Glycosyltransferase WbuB n=1 Tax=Chitinophaga parva TaxID=2169414 RepID=A0A2T7BJ10_9BACT|nr:glycosyltransferase WbuB [Chitinophaga parva]